MVDTLKLDWGRLLPAALRHRLAGKHGLHAVLANSGWLMLDRLLRIVLSLLVGAWVARHLGPARYGELAYVIALVALWQAISTLGLDAIIVRDVAQDRQAAPSVLGTAMGLRLVGGFACWIGAVALTAALRPGDTSAILIAALLGANLVFQSSEVVDLWFQSQTRSRLAIAAKVPAYTTASLVKVALILADAPLWAFAAALLCDTVFAAAAMAWVYRLSPAGTPWRWDRTRALRMLRESWPFMIAGLSVVVYMRIDQLVLRALADERELGLYSAILPLSQAWHMVPMTICASVLPRLSVLKASNAALYAIRMRQLFSLMAWAGIAAAAITAVCAPWVVAMLLGSAYAEAALVLRWHGITNVFVFLGVAQSVAIVSDRTPYMALYRTLFGAAVSLTMNLVLVPRWGATGAAWAAVASYFAAAVLSNLFLAPLYLKMQLRALWPFNATHP